MERTAFSRSILLRCRYSTIRFVILLLCIFQTITIFITAPDIYSSFGFSTHDFKPSHLDNPQSISYVLNDGPSKPLDSDQSLFADLPQLPPLSFRRYLVWHAKMMDCIETRSCTIPYPKFLVWRCPEGKSSRCSGLGDRLRGMTSALALAMLTNRVFLIDWPDNPYPLLHAVSPSALDWRMPKQWNVNEWATIDDEKSPLLKWVRCPESFTCYKRNDSSMLVDQFNIPQTMNINHASTLKYLESVGHFSMYSRATYSYALFNREEWRQKFPDFYGRRTHGDVLRRYMLHALFKPSPLVKSLLETLVPETITKMGFLAIHVRTGEDVKEMNVLRFRIFAKDSHLIIVQRLMKCVSLMGGSEKLTRYLYLASDSVKFKQTFFKTNDAGVHISYSIVKGAHVAKDLLAQSDNTINKWQTENDVIKLFSQKQYHVFLNIFVDFFAIVRAKFIISTTSEFSRQAIVMSYAKESRTFNVSDGGNGLKTCV